jgi:hypothetical protein
MKTFLFSVLICIGLFIGCSEKESRSADQSAQELTPDPGISYFVKVNGTEVGEKIKLSVRTNIPTPCSVLVSIYASGLNTRKDKTFGLAKMQIVELAGLETNLEFDQMDAIGEEKLAMGKYVVTAKYDQFLAMRAVNLKARSIQNISVENDTLNITGSGTPVAKILQRNRSM